MDRLQRPHDRFALHAGVRRCHGRAVPPGQRGRGLPPVRSHVLHRGSHISYLTEAQVNEPIYVTTQILGLDSKRLHVFHRLLRERDNELVASCEQMHLHVDTQAHKAALIRPEVLARLEAMRAPHVALPRPAQAGRSIGIPAR
ncbi:MAG: thioesterase family protein [Steroidobacteraceae bacterium]